MTREEREEYYRKNPDLQYCFTGVPYDALNERQQRIISLICELESLVRDGELRIQTLESMIVKLVERYVIPQD